MASLFTLEKIDKVYSSFRYSKRGTINGLRFDEHLLNNICDLHDELVARATNPLLSCVLCRNGRNSARYLPRNSGTELFITFWLSILG